MFGTAAEYRTVNGLKPDAKKHLIFADIEPVCINSIGIEFQMFDKFGHFVNIFQKKKIFCSEYGISSERCKTPATQHVSQTNQSN